MKETIMGIVISILTVICFLEYQEIKDKDRIYANLEKYEEEWHKRYHEKRKEYDYVIGLIKLSRDYGSTDLLYRNAKVFNLIADKDNDCE